VPHCPTASEEAIMLTLTDNAVSGRTPTTQLTCQSDTGLRIMARQRVVVLPARPPRPLRLATRSWKREGARVF
jgi:hypothetical protein